MGVRRLCLGLILVGASLTSELCGAASCAKKSKQTHPNILHATATAANYELARGAAIAEIAMQLGAKVRVRSEVSSHTHGAEVASEVLAEFSGALTGIEVAEHCVAKGLHHVTVKLDLAAYLRALERELSEVLAHHRRGYGVSDDDPVAARLHAALHKSRLDSVARTLQHCRRLGGCARLGHQVPVHRAEARLRYRAVIVGPAVPKGMLETIQRHLAGLGLEPDATEPDLIAEISCELRVNDEARGVFFFVVAEARCPVSFLTVAGQILERFELEGKSIGTGRDAVLEAVARNLKPAD